MSMQFGCWNFDGKPVTRPYGANVNSVISQRGPDGGGEFSQDGVLVACEAFDTTKQRCHERQPRVLHSGCVLTFDGRLDNRDALTKELHLSSDADRSDAEIVGAAYERWGTDSLRMLVGDWALTVWNPGERSLLLAKDPIGVRALYYSLSSGRVTWSTLLEPLIESSGSALKLDEEYIAGWLSFLPAPDLTPYLGISSVLPASFVRIEGGRMTTARYWDFDPTNKIRCSSDKDYEDRFRALFREAVRRRLRSDWPVLAELSGGIDSSSIVCVADSLLESEPCLTERLDTVSYFDDSEPSWNERPYFTAVEHQRRRTGCHVDVGLIDASESHWTTDRFRVFPGSGAGSRLIHELQQLIASGGNRVLLSGIGGDEFTGGVPTPVPELADLLRGARWLELARKLKAWALAKRTPWIQLLGETLRGFAPSRFRCAGESRKPAPWLTADFVRRQLPALSGYQRRLRVFGPAPSYQAHCSALETVQRQIAFLASSSELRCEHRYPYLDRDLLEFLFSIPREQLVRPGERRSLVRRSLAGIVPDMVLNRKRKAFVSRQPRVAIANQWNTLVERIPQMISVSLGVVDPGGFRAALEEARCGRDVAILPLLRTLELESWLRGLGDKTITENERPESTTHERFA